MMTRAKHAESVADRSPETDPAWSLADLIDFELLIEEDSKSDPADLASRDERIREEVIQPLSDSEKNQRSQDTAKNRRWWLHRWVFARRQAENPESESAGLVIESSISAVAGIFWIAGVVLGLFSILGFLAAPKKVVDVPIILLIYLGPQVLLLIFALATFLRQRFGWPVPRSVLLTVLSHVLAALFRKLGSRIDERIESRTQLKKFDAGARLILGRGKLRREALGWPLLCLLQRAGAAFSAAVVIGMLVVCVSSHFNFGWGSSWNRIDAGVVHTLARAFATPWSWLLREGVGYPTLEEVRRSRTYRDRALAEDFPRLSSWWIFICLSLFTYTLVPRILFLGYSRWRSRRALDAEAFQDRRSDRLFRRIAKPQLKRTVSPASPEVQGPPEKPISTRTTLDVNPTRSVPPSHCEILTELEFEPEEKEKVAGRIKQRLQLQVSAFNYVYSPKEQEAALQGLGSLHWEDRIPRVLLLYRASDPIVANLRHLVDQVLERIGSEGHLMFGLLGKASLISDPADSEEVEIWLEYANRLKVSHPNVEIEVLTDPEK